MNYRRIGNTAISVSEIALGAWGIGGTTKGAKAYGHTNDGISQRTLQKAYDFGVNFYDTKSFTSVHHSLIKGGLCRLRRQSKFFGTTY